MRNPSLKPLRLINEAEFYANDMSVPSDRNQANNIESSNSTPLPARESGSNIYGASANFINSIVGAGIIGIPYAIDQCGFFTGVFMLAFVAYLINCSVLMLIDCGLRCGKLDLEEVVDHYLGEFGYYVALLFMFIFAYGAQIAYMVIVGDTIPLVAEVFSPDSIFTSREFVMILSATFIVLPTCLMRDLSSLSWVSVLSVLSDVILVVLIVAVSPSAARKEGIPKAPLQVISTSLFAGIGTMSFAFVCQHNSFIVFRSLRHPTFENWKVVARISIVFSFSLCLMLGLAGYLSFYAQTQGDLLNNFPPNDNSMGAGRVLLAFCMLLTFPMELYVSRHCAISIYHRVKSKHARHEERHLLVPQQQLISTIDSSSLLQHHFPGHDDEGKSTSAGRDVVVPVTSNPLARGNTHSNARKNDDTTDQIIRQSNRVSTSNSSYSSNVVHREKDDAVMRETIVDDFDSVTDIDICVDSSGGSNGPRNEYSRTFSANASSGGNDAAASHEESSSSSATLGHSSTPAPLSLFMHVSLTIVIWGSALFFAVVFEDLSFVLSLTGAVAGSMLGYVLPALIYFNSYNAEFRLALTEAFYSRSYSDCGVSPDVSSNGSSSLLSGSGTCLHQSTSGNSHEAAAKGPVNHREGSDKVGQQYSPLDADSTVDAEVVISFNPQHIALAESSIRMVTIIDNTTSTPTERQGQILIDKFERTNCSDRVASVVSRCFTAICLPLRAISRLRQFIVPGFMVLFGIMSLVVGVATVMYEE